MANKKPARAVKANLSKSQRAKASSKQKVVATPKRKTPSAKAKPQSSKPSKKPKKRQSARAASRKRNPEIEIKKIVKLLIAILVLPFLFALAQCFFTGFSLATLKYNFWQVDSFWFFMLGGLIWTIIFVGLKWQPTWWYVLGHELTHAFFTLLYGGRVAKIHVSKKGGHVLIDRSNTVISLSPYFVPFYAVVALLLYWIIGLFWDILAADFYLRLWSWSLHFHPRWGLYMILGMAWFFHLTFTVMMLRRDQPDLLENGWFFSIVFVALCNLLIMSAMLILAAPSVSLSEYWQNWQILSGKWLEWLIGIFT